MDNYRERMTNVLDEVLEVARDARRVVVLTGAGISAESGLPTFRDPEDGLWNRYDPMQLASIEAWDEDPEMVWAWYLWRFERHHQVEPNAGHRALADWEKGADVLVVTQNVDDLHERGGSSDVVHLHGNLSAFRCSDCERPYTDRVDVPHEPVERLTPPSCPACGGLVRPGVVWFGEMLPPDAFDRAVEEVQSADLVLTVGTSGIVAPASLLPRFAGARGVPVIEINPNPTEHSDEVTHVWRAPAASALPALVQAIRAT